MYSDLEKLYVTLDHWRSVMNRHCIITFVIMNIFTTFVHNNEHYGVKEASTITQNS